MVKVGALRQLLHQPNLCAVVKSRLITRLEFHVESGCTACDPVLLAFREAAPCVLAIHRADQGIEQVDEPLWKKLPGCGLLLRMGGSPRADGENHVEVGNALPNLLGFVHGQL